MEHFKVLPTDKRIKRLTDDQIDILFIYHLMKPEESALRETYQRQSLIEEKQNGLPIDQLKKQGFTDEDIEQIKRDLEKTV